jgi:class 3 adenylate cyclase
MSDSANAPDRRQCDRGPPTPGARSLGAWVNAPRPEALLALLVTDLVSFTPLVQRLGDVEAQRLIQIHNRLLRDRIRAGDGIEIAHTGDGLMAAFRSVCRALACAAEIQQRLGDYTRSHPEAPLRARIGVHAGEPLPEDGRLFGACINTAVRICSAALPERVFVSDVVRQLAIGKAVPFEDRGSFALKGMAAPVHLHELLWYQNGAASEVAPRETTKDEGGAARVSARNAPSSARVPEV